MNERRYEKRLEFQQKLVSRQYEQIDSLKNEVEKLKLEIKKKDEIISSVNSLRKELSDNINEIKQKKKEYKTLIQELKDMKKIVNQEVYRGRWKIVRWIIKL